MDVVRIQSRPYHPSTESEDKPHPSRPPQLTPSPTPSPSPPLSTVPYDDAHRQWHVSICLNDNDPVQTVIQDPFLETEYTSVFEQYLHSSDRQTWSPQNLNLEENGTDALSRSEDRIQAYGETLLSHLGLRSPSFTPGAVECHIIVTEHHDHAGELSASAKSTAGLHCLAWELLESVHLPRLPQLRFRITREIVCPRRRHRLDSFALPRPPRPLAEVQINTAETFRVLLVVARDFSRTGAIRDPEPDLAQWPLMRMQKKLRSRMLLEVVRPGSHEELADHLAARASQGLQFGLVHFDLHGRVMRDEHGNHTPWLLFAKKNHVPSSQGYQVPQTHLAKAEDIAILLASYQIENVVLNACLSAYNRSGHATNLAHMFLKHGVQNVSAMWFYVHWQTVATYLDTFYEELLVKCTEFHAAAQKGRDAIRQKPTSRTGREYQDFFLCVNYTKNARGPDSTLTRQPSPTPSAKSQDSSTSTTSTKSFMSGVWKPSTPRLGDAFLVGDEPVMRMKLHLLELEYKLMTFRILYASDLTGLDTPLGETIDKMVNMWLNTNLVDEVLFYKAKDFAKRKILTDNITPRERRSRGTNGGYLQLLFPRPVKALRQTVHIVRDVDAVVDPGTQADAVSNARSEERRFAAEENLLRFTRRVLGGNGQEGVGGGRSYVLLLGCQDAQWWRTYLQHLGGDWWVHAPWSYTLHSRWVRDGSRGGGLFGQRGQSAPLGI